jgi:hypothetical protein
MITVLCSTEVKEQVISQKLIIASSHTAESLEAIKKYCNENTIIHTLQKNHPFNIQMQRLGDYNVTVISPIKSVSVRNTLFIVLSPVFKDIFYVEDIQKQISEVPSEKMAEDKMLWMYYGIGLQWISLLLLSLIGLFLSIKSRRKINELIESQDELLLEQQKMEREIKSLGGDSA